MSSVFYEFDEVDEFSTGAVGEPGSRVFYLSARHGRQRVTVRCEKLQVKAISTWLRNVLNDLPPSENRPMLGQQELAVVPDHAFVLGPIGRNFAAGMTGGVAYVYSEQPESLAARVHGESVVLQQGLGVHERWVRAWIGEHHERTGSARAADLLRRWPHARELFHVVHPRSEALTIQTHAAAAAAAPARS